MYPIAYNNKCKELRISFSKEPAAFDPVVIEGKEIEIVSSVKLLDLKLASDLTWNDHITEVVKKASKSLYFLIQLKRARVPPHESRTFLYFMCKV